MLLLRDFLRLAARVEPRSTVAFSLSIDFAEGMCPPIDLRWRRVAGMVVSPREAMSKLGGSDAMAAARRALSRFEGDLVNCK
jgi:hypothetical protein